MESGAAVFAGCSQGPDNNKRIVALECHGNIHARSADHFVKERSLRD
jgi:hypothetical protein